jgi:hypothetical protein
MKSQLSFRLGLLCASVLLAVAAQARERWTESQANAWYAKQPWPVGCNFSPSTAINQLEMWQADTFDLATIKRELGWAQSLGFNSVRVFLHDIPWRQDRKGFLKRMEQFLKAADQHGIRVMFVPLDACWDPRPRPGQQREPRPHVHNSGWVQCPGAAILGDPARHDELRDYVTGVIRHFRKDRRVLAWDIFNEPDNDNRNSYGANGANIEIRNKADMAYALLTKAFVWAREADPRQPITAGVWVGPWPDAAKLAPIDQLMIGQSDVISFHNYGPLDQVKERVTQLRRFNRPLLCTEYMARPAGSTFDPILAYFKAEKVGAYNWGFVAGKTQTIYPWDTWQKSYSAEPPVWFHDIFRANGQPFDPREVAYIKSVTGAK